VSAAGRAGLRPWGDRGSGRWVLRRPTQGFFLSCESQEEDRAVDGTCVTALLPAWVCLRPAVPAGSVPSGDLAQPCCWQDLAAVVGSSSLSPPDPWDLQSAGLSYPAQSWPRTRLEVTAGAGQAESPANCLVALWFVRPLPLRKLSCRALLSKLQLGCGSGRAALKAHQESCFLAPEGGC